MNSNVCCPTADAIQAITFFPCRIVDDYYHPDRSRSFKPLYVHKSFSDELIIGWYECCVNVYFTTDTFDVYTTVEGIATPSAALNTYKNCESAEDSKHNSNSPKRNHTDSHFGFSDDLDSNLTNDECIAKLEEELANLINNEPYKAIVNPIIKKTSIIMKRMNNDSTSGYDDEMIDQYIYKRAVEIIIDQLANSPLYTNGFCKSLNEFLEKLTFKTRSAFQPVGQLVSQIEIKDEINCKSNTGQDTSLHRPLPTNGVSETVSVYSVSFIPGNTQVEFIHRRIEWMLHFFIDACSRIAYDSRWRVLLIYLNGQIAEQESTIEMKKTNKDIDSKLQNHGLGASYSGRNQSKNEDANYKRQFTGSKQRDGNGMAKKHKSGDCMGSHSIDEESASTSKIDTSFIDSQSGRTCVKPELDYRGHELVGFVSLYKFFSLPKCRIRLSQFATLPYYQRRGLGLSLLQYVHKQVAADDNVMEFSVEDPAANFQQMRNVASIIVGVQDRCIPINILYPLSETRKIEHDQKLEKPFVLLHKKEISRKRDAHAGSCPCESTTEADDVANENICENNFPITGIDVHQNDIEYLHMMKDFCKRIHELSSQEATSYKSGTLNVADNQSLNISSPPMIGENGEKQRNNLICILNLVDTALRNYTKECPIQRRRVRRLIKLCLRLPHPLPSFIKDLIDRCRKNDSMMKVCASFSSTVSAIIGMDLQTEMKFLRARPDVQEECLNAFASDCRAIEKIRQVCSLDRASIRDCYDIITIDELRQKRLNVQVIEFEQP